MVELILIMPTYLKKDDQPPSNPRSPVKHPFLCILILRNL